MSSWRPRAEVETFDSAGAGRKADEPRGDRRREQARGEIGDALRAKKRESRGIGVDETQPVALGDQHGRAGAIERGDASFGQGGGNVRPKSL